MKKIFFAVLFMLLTIPCFAVEEQSALITNKEVVTFTQDEKWGLKDNTGNIVVEPEYRRMVRLGENAWIVQNKKNKYGLIDSKGNILVPLKFAHADRTTSKFAKFGNYSDYGIYDEYGNIVVEPKYRRIDVLYGQMFLTYRNYKYGITGYDGRVILENKFDDIYMPKPNVMRIQYNGTWYELEQVNAETLTLPVQDHPLEADETFDLKDIVITTGAVSGYSVLTFSDYLIKVFSSISPAHEETIDELMLSQGADTVNIWLKLTWLPKYPFIFCRKYYENVRNPNNGPLTNVRNELKQQIK